MFRDPWEEIRRFEKRMDRLFAEFWGGHPGVRLLPSGETGLPSGETGMAPYEPLTLTREPFTDIQETDKEVVLTAEIPGVKKGDIKINATEDAIEISAESKSEVEEEKEGYVRKERSFGRFYRRYSLPSTVDPDKTKASYKNGVLEVRMPKTEPKKKGKPVTID
jgi:HSP20 family protein